LVFSRMASTLTPEQLAQAGRRFDEIVKPKDKLKPIEVAKKPVKKKEYPRVLGDIGTFYLDKKKIAEDLEKAQNSPYY